MAEIILRDIEKFFGSAYVIRKLNLVIKHREFVVLLGPSGCGKTTTLRAIAGLEEIDRGDILIDGKPVQNLEAGDRDIAFVFQLFALYPHLTAFENIAFPLRATGESKAGIDRKVRDVARSLQIEHLLDKRPSALAGGDMQRVAIGRALVRRPKAMLMDEPMGALDAKLREEMRTELKRLHLENEATTVYVTHDQVEAMSMADRIAIMNDGILQQVGTPEEVYHHPANLFVAQFVGSPVMNIAPVTIAPKGNGLEVNLGGEPSGFEFPLELSAQISASASAGKDLTLGIRPEGVLLSREAKAGFVASHVHLIEPLGAYDIIDLKVGSSLLRARTKSGFASKAGEKVWVRLDPAQTHFFNSKSGESLHIRLGNGAN
jgi:multiple sugar transport system ATP-binding protein